MTDLSNTWRLLGQDVHQVRDLAHGNFTLTSSGGHVPSALALDRAAGSPEETEVSFPTSFFWQLCSYFIH